jgi:hypothetical protein
MASAGHGWCFACNEDIGDDLEAHFKERHSQPPDWKEVANEVIEDVINRLKKLQVMLND